MMQKGKIKIYLAFVAVLFAGVLFFSLKDNFRDIVSNLLHVNIIWLCLGIFCFLLSRYLIGLTIYELGVRENSKLNKKRMIEVSLIYPFYAGITPSSVGGEAFEIFYLKNSGLSYGGATNIQMEKFILYEISVLFINALAVIINFFTNIVVDSSFVGSAITLNFIVTFVSLGGSFLITYNNKIKNFILYKGIDLLSKIKIIKDPDKSRNKVGDFIEKFDAGTKELKSNKKLLCKLMIYNLLSLFLFLIVAYPVARAMHIKSISFINLFVLAVYVKMMSLLVVTPGNSGAAEYCFVYLFTGLIHEDDIMSYMLIWRFITYYIPLILGGLIALHWERRKAHEKINSIKS